MLDADTKRRIDTCRDILVGKVPDPKSQVEQITIALIYKFMDDMDAEAEELGGARSFFAGNYAKYGWAKLMAPNMGGFDVLALYSEAIGKMNENPGIPALFRDIFKNAYLPYRDPETLRSFLKEIDSFTYDHSERLGDAFEYLLSVLGSQGDAGQFRTPRHIIDFMVEVIDPKKNESVLDPACGTAGFLISAWKHILKQNTKERPGDQLTPEERANLAANIRGYDISPDMVRLSLVNMYLHGFTDPHIVEYDTLTSEERWNETADVILANPPFMSPKGGVKPPHKRFSVQSKRSEVLFLDYFLDHLSSNGKAGIIVPEGIHFVEQSGHVQLRRKLLEDGFLLADITLPHGVFKPYASVKTHILIVDRKLARQADSVLFVEIENDGFTQTDTREPVSGSQIGEAADLISQFRQAVVDRREWKSGGAPVRAYAIRKSDLLLGRATHILGRWHDLPNRVIHRSDVPLMRIGDICEIRDGLSPNMATPPGDFALVVPAEEKKTSDHWDFDGRAICIPLVSSSGHGKADIKRLHFHEGKFALATTMCALFVNDEKVVNPRYLHLFLSATSNELLVPLMCGATNVTMSSDQLRDVLVPIPSRSKQDEVVESHFIGTTASEMIFAAKALRAATANYAIRKITDQLTLDIESLMATVDGMATVEDFLPNGSVG
ncbi:N-6 DNA methylase [Zoogloea sp.]|uniref:N-6 DNA methylase n=1 Tax=Zoogloea sp. TaxID=49181 RepID=UPI001D8AD89C|nr:N-6 DNA methylase [Zoogloea sp.]MBK6655628.1 N-6 DNA methylase [Zoogloea sp.]